MTRELNIGANYGVPCELQIPACIVSSHFLTFLSSVMFDRPSLFSYSLCEKDMSEKND